MTILRQTVYASAPTGETLIPSLEILVPGYPIRICDGFEDHYLGIDGQYHLFEAGSLSVALPSRNTTGQQNLMFGIANVNGLVQRYVDMALESGEEVPIIYREYLASDKSAPMSRPLRMIMRGGVLEGGEARLEASFQDLLNQAWPRQRYTASNAPGIRYL